MVTMEHLNPMGRIDLFRKLHGDDYVVRDDGSILYADGAIEVHRFNGPLTVELREPPEHPWQLAKLRLQFHTIRYERARAKYSKTKQDYMDETDPRRDPSGSVTTPEAAVEHLKTLKVEVNRLKKLVAAAQAEVDKTEPQLMKLRRAQSDRVRKQREALQRAVKRA